MYFSPRTPEQGVYEFPRLTLLGFDTGEPQLRRLSQLGLKVKYMKVSCFMRIPVLHLMTCRSLPCLATV